MADEISKITTQSLKFLEERSSLLLLLPFLHLCVCFLYLAAYFYIIQSNLSIFSDPTDVFSVSFTNIAPFYLSMLILIINFPNVDRLDEIPRGCVVIVPSVIMLCFSLYIVATIVAEYRLSGYVYIPSVWFVAVIAFIVIPDLLPRRLTKDRRGVFFFFGWFLISILFSAGLQAQRDRYHSYHKLAADFPSCNGNIIVNKFGDDYLVVRKDNSRWLTDRACKLGAQITRPLNHPYPENWHIDWWPF